MEEDDLKTRNDKMNWNQILNIVFACLTGVMIFMISVMYVKLQEGRQHMTDRIKHSAVCINCDFKPPDEDVSFQSSGSIAPLEKSIAIGLGLTTRKQEYVNENNMVHALPFFKRLLQSFCRTASPSFSYHFYVAHDHNDPFFKKPGSHGIFTKKFKRYVKSNCQRNGNVALHLVLCNHTGSPAWAQNDAMMDAYLDNMAYFYRVNDDTVMRTYHWTEKFIDQLQRYNPPNVGVTGPNCIGGNTYILTHDFVHRTHIEIFGFYYPRIFTDWFADDWITRIYAPERSRPASWVWVHHTMELSSRYVTHAEKAVFVESEVEVGKLIIQQWIYGEKFGKQRNLNTTNVISFAMEAMDYDAIHELTRYAAMAMVVFPEWRIRAYVDNDDVPADEETRIVWKKMKRMGIELIHVGNITGAADIALPMRGLLVADDPSVERFLVRNPHTRPTTREALAVAEWMDSEKPMYCIRDHPEHSLYPLYPELIGGINDKLSHILKTKWVDMMRGEKSYFKFLEKKIWPKVKDDCMCHDSITCNRWPGALPFPALRRDKSYVGQLLGDNEQPDPDDLKPWNRTYIVPKCIFIKNTGFSDRAVKATVQRQVVLWSQDYHITPIMDIKNLLYPLGVTVIDKSLSFYCGMTGSCVRDLKIINRDNGMQLTRDIIDQFYEVYKNDETMKRVTAYVCTFPVAMCEAFMKFNKSIIVIATTRYEQGRARSDEWLTLNDNLIEISKNPRNIIAANNLYDLKYMEYFTGLKPLLVPNSCEYIKASYKPTRKHFLLVPIHSTPLDEHFMLELDRIMMRDRVDIPVVGLRKMYRYYAYADLASHRGIIYIPYQVSLASFTEQYRMNIPTFFPTIDLLTKWHIRYQAVRQRTYATYTMKIGKKSSIPGVIKSPDPNNDEDPNAVRYWLKFADYYQWPHIIYYESIPDLVYKLRTTNLTTVSENMKEHNKKARTYIKKVWSDILTRIAE